MNDIKKKKACRKVQRRKLIEKKGLLYPLVALMLLTVIIVVFATILIVPDRAYSQTEKRNLAQMPEISLGAVSSGEFMTGAEKYVADQFPLRDFWMRFSTETKKLFGYNLSQGVYCCADDYLMEKFDEPDLTLLDDTTSAINSFIKRHDVKAEFVLVPNAIDIYPERLPDNAITAKQSQYIDTFYSELDTNIKCLDIEKLFLDHKATDLYYHTDHHWTTDGAYLAYTEFAAYNGFGKEEFTSGNVADSFTGSLASKSGFYPDTLDSVKVYINKKNITYTVSYDQEKIFAATVYDLEALNSDDSYQVFFGGNHKTVRIKTDIEGKDTLLVIKDSYANCFIPFLLGHYKNIIIIDPRYYDDDIDLLMQTDNISEVLFLYNVNTLSEDNNLLTVLKNEQ